MDMFVPEAIDAYDDLGMDCNLLFVFVAYLLEPRVVEVTEDEIEIENPEEVEEIEEMDVI
jgi:hypothetical protein